MPTDMTITKVGAARPYEYPPGNHLVAYTIELEGHGKAELSQKPETPVPTVGQSIFADLEPSKKPGFPPKARKRDRADFQTSSVQIPPGYPSSSGHTQSREDPTQRSIERQVSAKIASELIVAGKAELSKFRELTDRVYTAIEGE